jgi:chromosome segregation ATPase
MECIHVLSTTPIASTNGRTTPTNIAPLWPIGGRQERLGKSHRVFAKERDKEKWLVGSAYLLAARSQRQKRDGLPDNPLFLMLLIFLCYTQAGREADRMPTLEERLEALERERAAARAQLQRIDEQIRILQQQITEQRRLRSEQERSTHEKFDGFMQVLVRHASIVVERFDSQESTLSTLQERSGQQTAEIKEASRNAADASQNATITLGLAQTLQANIHSLNRRFDSVDQQISSVKEDITDLDIKYDRLDRNVTDLHGKFDALDSKVDQQGQDIKNLTSKVDQQGETQSRLLQQILDRLPPTSSS